ncbi:hypothetical protein PH5382_03559 [Phaeobacter sp. CECT 5382]|uniref:hypothetical protein n=1 Tax=Phaeobacter sp. CECT 5382 TaxID=1712645 RepID=UPI0006DA95E8|nr:hypothetical protein [Phaeobacter sp. CECT 5382]CUH89611.1 hypothetical protein PH5382_03559 [Phaeobacter sp. CECT 5382]
MHKIFSEIPERIIWNAKAAVSQANTHAVYLDPGREYWGNTSVLNAAHAGELVLKALIARSHPLLIFKNISDLYEGSTNELQLKRMLEKGRTHDFQHLPNILWAVTGISLPDRDSFDRILKLRNAVQHFYHPDGIENFGVVASETSLEFLYKNVDPLLKKYFHCCAIEFHEDPSVGYDYVVERLVRLEQKFSMPDDFDLSEIGLDEASAEVSLEYRTWLRSSLSSIDRLDLLE